MYRKHLLFAASLMIVLSLSARGSPAGTTLSEKDSGKTIELGVGDTLAVELEGNPTTGYLWEVASEDTTVLTLVKDEYESDSDLAGSGGMFKFTFEAAAPGETTLLLVYRRPWEEDVDPIETFEVTVVVK